jgi:hypothetical protein
MAISRLRVIFDRVIELSLKVDVRFDPACDRGRAATQYVAMSQDRTHVLGPSCQLFRFTASFASRLNSNKKG